jgi:hypothetical protein
MIQTTTTASVVFTTNTTSERFYNDKVNVVFRCCQGVGVKLIIIDWVGLLQLVFKGWLWLNDTMG